MSEAPEPTRSEPNPPRRSILGARLTGRQAALGRGLDTLIGSNRPPALPAGQTGLDAGEGAEATEYGGVNRSALLSRLQGSHRSDLTRGFRSLLGAGLSADPPPAAAPAAAMWATAPAGPPPGTAFAGLRAPFQSGDAPEAPSSQYHLRLISLAAIRPSPYQPRAAVDPVSIARLAQSIRELGILQPLVVMPAPAPPGSFEVTYLVISGERRRQAALQAGLVEVPAIVKEIAPGAALHLVLTEDLHSAPLDVLDRARLYARLTRELRLPITEVASRLGVSAEEVASRIQLLSLDPEIIETIQGGQIGAAQADLLATVPDEALRRRLWRQAIRHGWSRERMQLALDRWTTPA